MAHKIYVEMIEKQPGTGLERVTDKAFTCCLCGSHWIGWGNNPDPLGSAQTDRCCDFCNFNRVLPARMSQLNRVRAK